MELNEKVYVKILKELHNSHITLDLNLFLVYNKRNILISGKK